MKRRWTAWLAALALALCACAGCAQDGAGQTPGAAEPTAALSAPMQPGAEQTPGAAETEPAAAPQGTAEDAPARAAFELTEPLQSSPMAQPLLRTVSLRAIDWDAACAGDAYETAYYQTELDFSGLTLTLLSLSAGEDEVRIRLRVRHPDQWSLLESQSMNGYFLSVMVLLDGEQAQGFCVAEKSPRLCAATRAQRLGEYEVELYSGALGAAELAAHETLTLLPYVDVYERYVETNHSRREGDAFICGGELAHRCIPWRELLPERAVQIGLREAAAGVAPAAPAAAAPQPVEVTLQIPDHARNIASGAYRQEGEADVYHTYRNETLDVSGLRIDVDTFEVTEHYVRYVLHVRYPEQWTDEQIEGLGLNVRLYLDGEPLSRGAVPVSGRRGSPPLEEMDDAQQRVLCREYYLACFVPRSLAAPLLTAQQISFVPEFYYTDRLTLGARVYDLSAGETAYGSFMEDSTEWQLRTLEQARAVVPPELTQPVPEG